MSDIKKTLKGWICNGCQFESCCSGTVNNCQLENAYVELNDYKSETLDMVITIIDTKELYYHNSEIYGALEELKKELEGMKNE